MKVTDTPHPTSPHRGGEEIKDEGALRALRCSWFDKLGTGSADSVPAKAGMGVIGQPDYSFGTRMISILRFFALPSELSFFTIGLYSP